MYILGINISHDSSTCLIEDGKILFYQEEERFSKAKRNNPNRRFNPFIYHQISTIKKYTNFVEYIIFSSFKDHVNQDYRICFDILNQLKLNGIEWGQHIFNENEHHLYHASNASFCSGFNECACLVIDGCGSYLEERYETSLPFREIESVYCFDYKNGLSKKIKHYSTNGDGDLNTFSAINDDDFSLIKSDSISCGSLFHRFSYQLGYPNGAGKIMGLSSFGKMPNNYREWFFEINDVRITDNNVIFYFLNKIKNLHIEEQANILKILQEETKKHTIHLIKKSLEICNTKNIVLSGGYFLNCVNNYHYLKTFPDVNFYVDPIAHDGGTAIGAAKYLWYNITQDQTIRKLDSLYLGQH